MKCLDLDLVHLACPKEVWACLGGFEADFLAVLGEVSSLLRAERCLTGEDRVGVDPSDNFTSWVIESSMRASAAWKAVNDSPEAMDRSKTGRESVEALRTGVEV